MNTRQNLLRRASALVEAGAPSEAEALLRPLLEARPDDRDALGVLGAACLREGDPDKAIEIFGALAGSGPEGARPYTNLAMAYRQAGRAGDAELCCRRAVSLCGDEAGPRLDLAALLVETERPDEAWEVLLEAAERAPAAAAVWFRIAAVARRRGDPAACLRASARCLALDPANHESWNNRGAALSALGDAAAAIACLEIAAASDPLNPTVAVNRAQALVLDGRHAAAEAIAREVTILQPRLAAGHGVLGQALAGQGRDPEALSALTTALRLEPRSLDATFEIARILRRGGRLERALETIGWGLRVAPGDGALHAARAELLMLLGRLPEAFEAVEAPYRTAPTALPRLLPDADAATLAGRRILVVAPADLRRAVLLARYLPRLRERGAVIDGTGAAALAPLAAGLGCDAWHDPDRCDPDAYDGVTPFERLPRLFATNAAPVPFTAPYLAVPKPTAGDLRAAAAGAGRLILWSWSGTGRGLALGEAGVDRIVRRLADHGDRLVVLADDSHVWPAGAALTLATESGGAPTLDALVALLGAVDGLVATDDLPVHLAGATGVPGLVVLGREHDPAWPATGGIGPWYPSVRIARAEEAAGGGGDPAEAIVAWMDGAAPRR